MIKYVNYYDLWKKKNLFIFTDTCILTKMSHVKNESRQ